MAFGVRKCNCIFKTLHSYRMSSVHSTLGGGTECSSTWGFPPTWETGLCGRLLALWPGRHLGSESVQGRPQLSNPWHHEARFPTRSGVSLPAAPGAPRHHSPVLVCTVSSGGACTLCSVGTVPPPWSLGGHLGRSGPLQPPADSSGYRDI